MQFIDTLLKKHSIVKNARYYNLFITLFIVFIIFCFYLLSDFLTPLIIAIFFAYGLNAIVSKLQAKSFPSFIAISLPLIGFLVILSFIFYIFYINIESFLDSKLPFYETKFFNFLEELKLEFKGKEEIVLSIQNITKGLIEEGKSYILSFFKGTTSFLGDFFLFLLYLCFFLAGINNFKIKTNRALGEVRAKKINEINDRIVSQIQNYIMYKTVINLGLALSFGLINILYGLDLALLFASLAFVLNYIPMIGSLIGIALPILLSILQFSSFWYTASFVFLIILIQLIFSYIIEPKAFAKSLALSSFVVFVSLIFWSWLWGITGAFLSIPIMASIGIICDNIPSLRPINRFLQSAFPLPEDREKLSLIHHVIHADKTVSKNEKLIIERELKKDIYDKFKVRKLWKQIQKKPLSIEEIFQNKLDEDRVNLYYLALKISHLDNFTKEEEDIIRQIEALNSFSKLTINNINSLVNLKISGVLPSSEQGIIRGRIRERGEENNNVIRGDLGLSNKSIEPKEYNPLKEDNILEGKEREIAFSYKCLGRKCFEKKLNNEAFIYYLDALRLYLLMEDDSNIFECNRYLSILDAL